MVRGDGGLRVEVGADLGEGRRLVRLLDGDPEAHGEVPLPPYLDTVLDEFAVSSYDIQAVYPQQRYLPAKVRHFIDYLKAIYNRDGYWEG